MPLLARESALVLCDMLLLRDGAAVRVKLAMVLTELERELVVVGGTHAQ